jgi:hypothetical protein
MTFIFRSLSLISLNFLDLGDQVQKHLLGQHRYNNLIVIF